MNTLTPKPHPLAYKTFRCPPDAQVSNVVRVERQDARNGTGPLVQRTHLQIKPTQRSKYVPHVGKKQLERMAQS